MSKHPLPGLSNQILDEAAHWFVEHNEGARDRASRVAFNRWLRTSPEHVRAYLQIAAHWEEDAARAGAAVESIDELIGMGRADTNVVPLVRAPLLTSGSDIAKAPRRHSPRRQRTIARHPYALVACLLLAIAIPGAWFHLQRGVYTTDIGEQRSLRLADGSTVELNALTRIKVRFTEHERRIDLIKGQALFEVEKDKSRPFIVRTANTQVRAVGTRFDVYRKKIGTVVTVIEGRVAVLAGAAIRGAENSAMPQPGSTEGRSANTDVSHNDAAHSLQPTAEEQGRRRDRMNGVTDRSRSDESGSSMPLGAGGIHATSREILIAAGEQLTVAPAADARPQRANIAAATAWTQRRLVFDRAPLSEVVGEFNRYNPTPLVITDPALGETPISGAFSSSDPAALLRFLSEVGTYDIRHTSTAIEISRPAPTHK